MTSRFLSIYRRWLACLAACALASIVAPQSAAASEKQATLVIDSPLGVPARNAVQILTRVLTQRGLSVREAKSLPDAGMPVFVIGLADQSPAVGEILKAQQASVPAAAESLLVAKLQSDARAMVLVCGRDDRGLTYALLDVARAVELAPAESPLLDAIRDARESPFLRTRSMTVQLFNEELDGKWYFDEAFWRDYFSMLARNRYNNFSLTFAHQTNYMNPAYPWLLEVPKYPNVRVKGLSAADRRRNLDMLKRISELAHEYAIDFTFGLWTQQPVEHYGRTYLENFPEGAQAGDYCADALRLLLRECPAIDGVQFRMNVESGIAEGDQKAYFQGQFDAIKSSGRPVRLDLRYKGLRQQTIDQAVQSGLELTVSTKFWCEHMGLPFHPTSEDKNYRESRYGYGAMLYKPRNYRVVYRLWSVGSQRVLLWGDPTYAARFARACRVGDSDGFEVFAPLTNKGFGNEPGEWRVLVDRTVEHSRWEAQRYWYFYLVFGRLGYNPEASPEVWQREFRHRFRAAAKPMEDAYAQASQVIPLLTATRQQSASEWRFWPEMDTGGPLPAYAAIQPSDYQQFYAIRPWYHAEGWGTEAWHGGHSGFVEDAVADKVQAKWTPIQVSRRLYTLAVATQRSLQAARSELTEDELSGKRKAASEFRATERDLRVLALLARYHAEKLLAATHLEFFHVTAEAARLKAALTHLGNAAAAWQQLVELTDGAYHDNLVFGYGAQRVRQSQHAFLAHTGHWKDRLAEVQQDVAYVEGLLAKHGGATDRYRRLPGEEPPRDVPTIEHAPVTQAVAGKPLEILTRVSGGEALRSVLLHYRNLDQTVDWQTVAMQEPSKPGQFRATIPGEAIGSRYDLMYYLEARVAAGGTLWPDWQKRQPYVVVETAEAR